MITRFRTAYFCATCWRELARIHIALAVYGCPHCGHSLDEATLRRRVPARPRLFRTGLEPLLALWADTLRALRRRWLRARIAELNPTDWRVPVLSMKLAALETSPATRW